ncbi:MAG: hypothetical protein ACMV1C_02665 [Bacteroides graminisolvens]|jgi:hypothetical protein|uniref:hypothetical protein n=1 Tax=Bacteroides graminisolvens TaxID=477666 RepID=UPI003A836924|nr:hypothetical protein [Bacteroides graminisolvens]
MTDNVQVATIFASSYADVAKKASASKIGISLTMLALGVLSFVSILGMDDRSSTLSMMAMVVGSVLFLTGVFRLFWKSKQMVYVPTGSVVKEKSVYFDLKHLDTLKEGLDKKDFASLKALKSETSGNLRMDVLVSADHQFSVVQLFQFVPYNYTPITGLYHYKEQEASAFGTFLVSATTH